MSIEPITFYESSFNFIERGYFEDIKYFDFTYTWEDSIYDDGDGYVLWI